MQEWARKIREGDMRALARAATAVEESLPAARSLLSELYPFAGHARVIGVTGPPGAGKSTLVAEMTKVLRGEGRTVGIVSVDPTSPFSGGAILGDRIRMQEHHADPGVFIRSMATRGSLGGLAKATSGLATLLDAAGKDVVLIETVGVGQDEVDVACVADLTILVLVPGMGDDVQAIKAGLMEIADVFVVNKADRPGVERVESEIRAVLELADSRDKPLPVIVRTVASQGEGVPELMGVLRSLEQTHARKPRLCGLPDEPKSYRIDHVGIAVSSLGSALDFWEGRVGMRAASCESVPGEKVKVAMLPAGEARIELLEASSPDSVVARFLESRGEGLHHVALRVPDLTAAVERLRASGARLVGEPKEGAGGHRYVFVHPASAGGVLLELIEDKKS
jgi:GTPase